MFVPEGSKYGKGGSSGMNVNSINFQSIFAFFLFNFSETHQISIQITKFGKSLYGVGGFTIGVVGITTSLKKADDHLRMGNIVLT